MGKQYLIVIPATLSHHSTVELSVSEIHRNVAGSDYEILIVTPNPDDYAGLSRSMNLSVMSDEAAVDFTKAEIAELIPSDMPHGAGWYYQQLMKYSLVLRSKAKRVLIIDADTIVIGDPFRFIDAVGISREWNQSYFNHYELLLNMRPVLTDSAISNFMWFNPDILRAMLARVYPVQTEWWKAVLSHVGVRNGQFCSFSEYETYANWSCQSDSQIRRERIGVFRRGDLLVTSITPKRVVLSMVRHRGFDAVSFELTHTQGWFRRILVWVLLILGFKYW